jgi:hypothetical protein
MAMSASGFRTPSRTFHAMGAMVENAAIFAKISAFDARAWIALSPGAG